MTSNKLNLFSQTINELATLPQDSTPELRTKVLGSWNQFLSFSMNLETNKQRTYEDKIDRIQNKIDLLFKSVINACPRQDFLKVADQQIDQIFAHYSKTSLELVGINYDLQNKYKSSGEGRTTAIYTQRKLLRELGVMKNATDILADRGGDSAPGNAARNLSNTIDQKIRESNNVFIPPHTGNTNRNNNIRSNEYEDWGHNNNNNNNNVNRTPYHNPIHPPTNYSNDETERLISSSNNTTYSNRTTPRSPSSNWFSDCLRSIFAIIFRRKHKSE